MLVKDCFKCEIAHRRKHIVNGHGVKNKILFILEAPGYTEDKQGKMLVGIVGKVFIKILKAIKLYDKSYFINVIRCYPYNRPPSEHEVRNCSPYLIKEIQEVNPKIIVLLGGTAIRSYWGNPLMKVKDNAYKPKINNGKIVIGFYHPSYMLRPKRDSVAKEFITELIKVRKMLQLWEKQ